MSTASLFMPFTAHGKFKASPRMLERAAGVFYQAQDGRSILDAVSGLWCVNIGHGRTMMAEAIARQVSTLDYAPMFQMGHSTGFAYADRLLEFAPKGFGRVFLVNSGSEAVDTALKLALKFHKMRGEGQRSRLVGRERSYHGVGFGGISVGGMAANRKDFGPLLPGIDHLPHTHGLSENLFSRGQPPGGAYLADALERIVQLHDASTIAAVIVEPVAGSAGVLVPPVGYLERLREITKKHGILLIFDEVITGFGRLGSSFAADRMGVVPDMIVTAKAITNGTIPMGGVLINSEMLETFKNTPADQIDFYHGYTASAHPVACAAASVVLDAIEDEELLERAKKLEDCLEQSIHKLRGHPLVHDIRNFGLMGAVELTPDAVAGRRGLEVLQACFNKGVLVRATGDTIALAPALVSEAKHIDMAVGVLDGVLTSLE
ncbi:aminotransferase class III-fold pyridoxal phosphate-dependent enzyme [Xenophilus azovorans]|uniref:aminotransferase class III-fold pyridoxal phosphate-dependent enzyme n=1 Tax=Xenophilus azovorans TaxID=151755 RepID=UPI0009FE7112|nr:aminotransferase class III-fold pyridoxal phosphate-dependent enzyme [Xenophilus azovorans]